MFIYIFWNIAEFQEKFFFYFTYLANISFRHNFLTLFLNEKWCLLRSYSPSIGLQLLVTLFFFY